MGHFDNFFGDACEADAVYQKHRVFLLFAEYAATLMDDVARDIHRVADLSDAGRARLQIRIEHLATTLRNAPPSSPNPDEPFLLPVSASIAVVDGLLEELQSDHLQRLVTSNVVRVEIVGELESSAFIIKAYVGTVKRLAGVVSSNELGFTLPDDFVSRPISKAAKSVLRIMLDLNAFRHNPQSSQTICFAHSIGNTKKVFGFLKREQLVDGERGVGYWLTARGRVLASWYAANKEGNFEGTI